MKTVTLDLPDSIASVFESLPRERKINAALLTACLAQAKPKSLEELLARIDKRVAASGLSEKEIDEMLDELSWVKRVVLDTGVIISALLRKDGVSRRAFLIAVDNCKPLVSLPTLSELQEVLSRPKFKTAFTKEEATEALEIITQRCETIAVDSTFSACRDKKDDMFLNLAIDGKADVLLSRDPDLLELHPFHNIPIFNPADFIQWFEKSWFLFKRQPGQLLTSKLKIANWFIA